MPTEMIPLPLLGMDDREPVMLKDGASPSLANVRMHRNRLTVRPGWAVLADPTNPTSGGINIQTASFAHAPFTRLLKLDAAGAFFFYNFFTNSYQPIPQVGIPFGPALTIFERYATCNTLGAFFWSSFQQPIAIFDAGIQATLLEHDLGVPGSPPPHVGRTELAGICLLGFANRLIVVRTTEATVPKPVRVRWSANGDPTQMDPADFGAGFVDLQTASMAPLTGGFTLNERCYITRASLIEELIPTGDADVVFIPQVSYRGKGMIAPHSWASAEYFGFFLGPDNVYRWDGATLTPVGDPVRESIFANITVSDAAVGQVQEIVGCVYQRRHEYWLITGPSSGPDRKRVYIYDYYADKWYRDEIPGGDTTLPHWIASTEPSLAVGVLDPTNPLRQETLVLLSDISTLKLADGEDVPGGTAQGTSDNVGIQINGSFTIPIDAFVVTKDYYARDISGADNQRQAQGTLSKLNSLYEVRIQGTPGSRAEVGMSPDRGEHWVTKEVVVNEHGVGVGYFLKTYPLIRFRLRSVSTHPFELHGIISYLWKPAGANVSLL